MIRDRQKDDNDYLLQDLSNNKTCVGITNDTKDIICCFLKNTNRFNNREQLSLTLDFYVQLQI